MDDALTYGLLDDSGESVNLRLALPEARAKPWKYRLSDEVRRGHEQDYQTLTKHGCHGPLAAALARALRLDEEARRAPAD